MSLRYPLTCLFVFLAGCGDPAPEPQVVVAEAPVGKDVYMMYCAQCHGVDGDGKSLAENEDIKEFYLGFSEGNRASFRDAKHYRRRKRWLG